MFAICLLVCAHSVLAQDQPVVPSSQEALEIIDNVRRNERLYRDVEIRLRYTYDLHDRDPASACSAVNEVTDQLAQIQYIAIGDWFKVENTREIRTASRTSQIHRLHGFDGDQDKLLEGSVGNVAEVRGEDSDFVFPHTLMLKSYKFSLPLSVYLAGHEAILGHPGKGRYNKPSMTAQTTYLGEDEVLGLRCQKILVKILSNGDEYNGDLFWLASERNFLPVKRYAYTYPVSREIPMAESYCRDLREIEPGVWFPFEVETTAYCSVNLKQEGKQARNWQERILVEEVTLNPKYDKSFFSIEFPRNTASYEIQNGEIKQSWREGSAVNSADRDPRDRENMLWWIAGANLLILVPLIVWAATRNRSRS